MADPLFTVSVEGSSSLATVRAAGELDMATSPRLDTAIGELLEQGVRDIVLDLEKVSFIDSSGIRALLLVQRSASERSAAVTLARPSEQVMRALTIAGVRQQLRVEES